jgi:hypothetical protein
MALGAVRCRWCVLGVGMPHKAEAGKVEVILHNTPFKISPAVSLGAMRLEAPGRHSRWGINQPLPRVCIFVR